MADEYSRWSLLPDDLLLLIVKRLDTRLDNLRLRSVCTSWRSSVPPFKKTPPLTLTLPFPILLNHAFHSNCTGHYCLSESPIFIFLSPDDQILPNEIWLLRVEEKGNGKFRPVNPLSRILTETVPRNFPKVLNLMDVRVLEIGKGISLMFVNTSTNIDHQESMSIIKVVVSTHPFTPNGNDFEFLVLVSIRARNPAGFMRRYRKLFYIKSGNEKWSAVDNENYYFDLAYYNEKFYAVNTKKTVVFVSDSGLGLEIKEALPQVLGGFCKYLVVSENCLFLIDVCFRPDYEDIDIDKDVLFYLKVFKLNEEIHNWEPVDSLDDSIFFVGKDCNYCLSVRDFPQLNRNCIYFLDTGFGDNEGLGNLFTNFGVYRMEDGECKALGWFTDHSKFFWPPPAWLRANPQPLKK